MPLSLRVLIYERPSGSADRVLQHLPEGTLAADSVRVVTLEQVRETLAGQCWDIVLCIWNVLGPEAIDLLPQVKECDPDLPILVVSGTVEVETAVEILRAGAGDLVLESSLTRLPAAVERLIREAATRRRHRHADREASRLAALVRSSTDAIIGETPDGIITDWNDAAERLYGWTEEEAVARHISFLVPPDKRAELEELVARVCRGEQIESFETIRLHRDGTRIDVAVTLSPVRDAAGQVIGASKVARDIRRSRAATETARLSEARFRALVEKGFDGVVLIDAVGRILYTSPPGLRILGRTTEEMSGQSGFALIHPDDLPRIQDIWTRLLASPGETLPSTHRALLPSGEARWLETHCTNLLDEEGVHGVVVNFRDITDRKRIEAERDQLLGQLELQIDRMPLAYLLSDPEFHYVRWNAAAERLFGFPEAEILGRHPCDTIVPPQSRSLVESIFARARLGDMDAHGICENVTRDGRMITCEWSNTPLFDSTGRFLGLLSLAQDVTEKRSLEGQLRQAQKMEAIGQLAGGIAHDFNNLLTIVQGCSELLLHQLAFDHPGRPLVEEIRQAGERSAALTRQLLVFSRKQVVQPQVLDLNAVVADAEKLLNRVLGEDIRLDTELHPLPGRVRIDPGQLQQVLLNLAVNARDAMPHGGRLTIATGSALLDEEYSRRHPGVSPGPFLLLSVRDTGVGMSSEVQAHIFEPFFTTKEVGKGSGLGLAVVHGIVHQAAGHIRVASNPGAGSTFEILLPCVDQPVSLGSSSHHLRPAPPGCETVLLVEDEEGVRALARHVLEGCGYVVLEASDGEKALEIARRHQGTIDLLVTDVVMPGMGGRHLAEQVLSLFPSIRVLYVSGYTDDAVVRHGVLHEQAHFLQKPFSPSALAHEVRRILDS